MIISKVSFCARPVALRKITPKNLSASIAEAAKERIAKKMAVQSCVKVGESGNAGVKYSETPAYGEVVTYGCADY